MVRFHAGLDQCDAAAIKEKFRPADTARTGEIDVGAKGSIEIGFPKKVQGDLALVIQESAWNLPRLANWIDSGILHPDITKPSAVVFITKAIETLIAEGYDITVLARNKYDLRKAISALINNLRGEREVGQYKALFATNAADFAVSADLSIIFDEQTYAPNQPYSGPTKFSKHYTRLVGDLLPTGKSSTARSTSTGMTRFDTGFGISTERSLPFGSNSLTTSSIPTSWRC